MINPTLIFQVNDNISFCNLALEIFRFQSQYNNVYKEYLNLIRIDPSKVIHINQIPFLPIEFFKTQKVVTGYKMPEKVFFSSGTTGSQVSKHYISDLSVYEMSFLNAFNIFYGKPNDYCFLALMPSIGQRPNSSLIYMVNKLIQSSKYVESGFILDDYDELEKRIEILLKREVRIIIFGLSYALLEFAEKKKIDLSRCIIIETGGMKGKREELTREELHHRLSFSFNTTNIHSEYSMTELLSQAYSKKQGNFYTPPWMRILIRDIYDPFRILPTNKHGAINIIDLANIYSVSFIETKDLGMLFDDGSFEVTGRFDNSDIRGCNLLIA
jgi:hypothetical protein